MVEVSRIIYNIEENSQLCENSLSVISKIHQSNGFSSCNESIVKVFISTLPALFDNSSV